MARGYMLIDMIYVLYWYNDRILCDIYGYEIALFGSIGGFEDEVMYHALLWLVMVRMVIWSLDIVWP